MVMERSSLRFDEAKGPKLLPRFVVYIALAAGLMVADYRFSLMQPVRAAVMPMLYPAQWLANQPVQLYQYFADLSQSKSELLEQNRQLLEENGRLKINLQRDKVNTDELRELKKLYGLQQKGIHNVIGAEVISNGKDPLSERLIIGKGSQDGLKVGDAVIDQSGLIGLLTQVHTQSAEIGLISGGQSIVPIAVSRTGERNLAYGNGNGLDLRYFPTGSDLKPGDVLLTSGLDGTYPAGIPVATVSKVVRASGTPYYDTKLTPLAALRSSRFVLVLSSASSSPR
jgi:rod shape-determining protein mreC